MITVLGYDGPVLSDRARELIAGADLLVGGQRHLDAARPAAPTVVLGPLEPAMAAIESAHEQGRSVVVLASGDPGFFGILRRLQEAQLPCEVRPAVSSVARAFALAGIAWTDADVVSVHGRDARRALNVVRRQEKVAVLTSPEVGPAQVASVLLGRGDRRLFVAERLGEQDERAGWYAPEEVAAREDWRVPNVVISHGETPVPVEAPWRLGRELQPGGWALHDQHFAHRDGMITKPEVRAVVLARLAPAPGTMVWDVGAGSGSVGVECSRLGAAVVAVEQADTTHLEQNARALGGPVRVVQGKAPEALIGLPQPDAVFVGGGGPEVVAAVAAVRPERVVVALATIERVGPTVAALEGYEVETVLVQVSALEPLGEGHRLVPANPVFVVSGVLL